MCALCQRTAAARLKLHRSHRPLGRCLVFADPVVVTVVWLIVVVVAVVVADCCCCCRYKIEVPKPAGYQQQHETPCLSFFCATDNNTQKERLLKSSKSSSCDGSKHSGRGKWGGAGHWQTKLLFC